MCQYTGFIVVVIFSLGVMFVLLCLIRTGSKLQNRISSWLFPERERQRQLEEEDRRVAELLQRELDEQGREEAKAQKRKERMEWYQMHLKPYFLHVHQEDFYEELSKHAVPKRQEKEKSSVSDIELGNDDETSKSKNICENRPAHTEIAFGDSVDPWLDDEDDGIRRYVCLPPTDNGAKPRCVEASCAICFKNYEVGDQIVGSSVDDGCPHVFHVTCIIEWLSLGKKRCPICRRWFVSPAKIDDQRKGYFEHHSETDSEDVGHIQPRDAVSTDANGDDDHRHEGHLEQHGHGSDSEGDYHSIVSESHEMSSLGELVDINLRERDDEQQNHSGDHSDGDYHSADEGTHELSRAREHLQQFVSVREC